MKMPLAVFLRAMNLRVKAVGAFRRSASFTSSAWRSQKTWTDLTAQLRADRINRPQIILSDEEEEDDSCVGMDESYTGLDEARLSSSSSAAAVCENPSKFKRPSSLTWKKELANSMSLIGTIDDNVRFKYTDSGKPLAWTSLHDEDKSFYSYARVGLYFLDELANIANQHLRKNDYVHVSGELEQRESKMWVMAKDLKFIQRLFTPDPGKHRFFKNNELWKAFFANPFEWRDHREQKINRGPDFIHKYTGEVLWVEDKYTPDWVKDRLVLLDSKVQRSRQQSR